MTKMTYAQAVTQTLERLMREDDRIIMIYPGIGEALPFKLPDDLRSRGFGMPIAELGHAGAATGAAVAGMRPMAQFGIGSFMIQAWPHVINDSP